MDSEKGWRLDPSCFCYRCASAYDRLHPPPHIFGGKASAFIVCPTCSNKRCPRATDHTLACTGSNTGGQPGSRFALPAPPETGDA